MKFVFACAVVLFFSFSVSSCKINGSFQGLYGYQNETMIECPDLIKKTSVSLCSLDNSGNSVYVINALQLKNCLDSDPTSIVYFWQPNCHSDACISPLYLQKIITDLNFQLFVVSEYYDCEQMRLNNILDKPIFGIDQDYYNTNLTSRYLQKFWMELTDSTDLVYNRFVLFEFDDPKISAPIIDEIIESQE